MANYKQGKVTQGVFDAVKICLQSGNSVAETAKFMKMAWDTVQLIRDAETLEEYKAVAYERSKKFKQNAAIKAKQKSKQEVEQEERQEVKPEEPAKQYVNPTVVKLEATHYMMQELQKTNELLTGISAKLAAIVNDLYGVKS